MNQKSSLPSASEELLLENRKPLKISREKGLIKQCSGACFYENEEYIWSSGRKLLNIHGEGGNGVNQIVIRPSCLHHSVSGWLTDTFPSDHGQKCHKAIAMHFFLPLNHHVRHNYYPTIQIMQTSSSIIDIANPLHFLLPLRLLGWRVRHSS